MDKRELKEISEAFTAIAASLTRIADVLEVDRRYGPSRLPGEERWRLPGEER